MIRHAPVQQKVATTQAQSGAIAPAESAPTSNASERSAERGHHFTDIPVSRPSLQAARGGAAPDGAPVHEAAKLGTSGPSGPLPHLERIQKSFGRHDVSGLVAHTDRNATAGAQAMGAAAFTRGEHVAFAEKPSLHMAAHEAAHSVQQRAGVNVPGGVGRAGDPYERHADAVANAVIQGRSSEALLEQMPDGGRASTSAPPSVQGKAAVQRTIVGPKGKNIWADHIAAEVFKLKDQKLKDKIHVLHSIQEEIPVRDFEELCANIKSGQYDAHFEKHKDRLASGDVKWDEHGSPQAMKPMSSAHAKKPDSNPEQPKQASSSKPVRHPLEFGLIHGHFDETENSIDLHVSAKGQGGGLTARDMYKAAVTCHNLMTNREAEKGPKGKFVLHPTGAAIVKIITELLGETLGGGWAKQKARAQQFSRKKFGRKGGSKNTDKLDANVLPEHFSYMDSLRGTGNVSIVPVITPMNPDSPYKATKLEDFTQDMMATTPEGNAQYNRYKGMLQDKEEQMGPSLDVTLTSDQLPKIIAVLESQL